MMTYRNTGRSYTQGCFPKGFTLIELLVVVLIIGILAAVAVPQYQFATIKSRVTSTFPAIKAINNARELYYLSNGTNTLDTSSLEIAVPSEWKGLEPRPNQVYMYTENFLIDASDNSVAFVYCKGLSNNYNQCWQQGEFRLYFTNYYSTLNYPKGSIVCFYKTNFGKKMCNSLPNVQIIEEE